MKVWIARDDGIGLAHAFYRRPKWDAYWGDWCGDSFSGYICMKALKRFGVKLKPGECKQYDIPMFREVKPKARKR